MSVDFCQLKLKINYNNVYNPYLQYGPGSGLQPPQEFQAGWTEVYDMPSPPGPNASTPNQTILVSAANALNLIAARASLLALNYYIFQAEIHQASVFRSSLPLPGSARFGGIDSNIRTWSATAYSQQICSNPEETVIVRQESVSMRRWERQIRGLKDYVSDDAMSNFPAVSWGPGTSTAFDASILAPQVPGASAGTPAVIGVTQAGPPGGLTGFSITSPGNYPLAKSGTYPLVINDPTGSGASGTFTLTYSGSTATVTSVTWIQGGQGYTAPVVTAPVTADPGGIALYQDPGALWANFASCLQNYTGSGQHQRVANTSFPSGYMTQLNNTPPLNGYYATQRVLIQRIGNRQTGKIRLTSPARRKKGI